jgi:hypothetical protein
MKDDADQNNQYVLNQWPNLIVKLDVERTLREFQETHTRLGDCAICGSVTELVAAAWDTPDRVDVFRVCEKCKSDLSVDEFNTALSDRREKAVGYRLEPWIKCSHRD